MFEPLVMFFGLMNSPATFQAMMNELFKELILAGTIFVYMDDILIATRTLEEHRRIVHQVLHILESNRLFLKPEKCEFKKDEVEYLGLCLQAGQLTMDPIKLKGIMDWPTPKKLKDVRAFLGFTGFYRCFVHNYSCLARPLNDLTKKVNPWHWGKPEQDAFDQLKQHFLEAPILIQPDLTAPFRLECDASMYASGAVLSQCSSDGLWHPVAFMSQSFIEAEQNYDIYDRELLAIIKALQEWRHYLEGSPHQLEILSDHKNLEVFCHASKLSYCQAHWAEFLSRFSFTIQHISGKKAGKPDALSCRPNHIPDHKDNEDRILLDSSLFSRSNHVEYNLVDSSLLERIKDSQKFDPEVLNVLHYLLALKSSVMKTTLAKNWQVQDGLVYYRGHLYIPMDLDLHHTIIFDAHDAVVAGHPGHVKTLESIRGSYYWPNMTKFIFAYVDGCSTCQSTKNLPNRMKVPLIPIIPQHNAVPFSTVSMDFITELPVSDTFDAIVVFVDHDVTKMVVFALCHSTITAEGTASLYRDHVWRRFGLPSKLISDRGPQFTSAFFRGLCSLLGVEQAMSMAYHPQTDGQTERVNQSLEQYLCAYTSIRQNNWLQHLTMAKFAHNNRLHSTINHMPFFALMGFHPRSLS